VCENGLANFLPAGVVHVHAGVTEVHIQDRTIHTDSDIRISYKELVIGPSLVSASRP
jgi:hypothetical protein